MRTKISNPKTELLLGAGLNTLHFESQEWLETIAFWKDEVRFFNDLLKKKEFSEKNNSEYEKMLKSLNKIHTDLFEDLENSIVEHEIVLSKILRKQVGISDNDYREKHLNVSLRMELFTSDFKTFKRVVFKYAKGL